MSRINSPEDISKIFGKDFFKEIIEPEALAEFKNTIKETFVEAVVAFNKGVFNHVAQKAVNRYIGRLMERELIQSQVDGIEGQIPIFLTFPTGWHYHKHHKIFRNANLDAMRVTLYKALKRP